MKRLALAIVAAVVCSAAFAWHPGPRPMHYGHHHHHHRGSAVAAGIIGGVVGGLLYEAVRPEPVVVAPAATVVQPAPVVVQQHVVVQQQPVVVQPAPVVVQQQPVYQTQNVWVDGRYVDQVQANGTTVRTWQPGHYEQRSVQVQ